MPAETVVITGAAAGVGRATARAFGRRGACIGLLARGVEDLNDAASEIEAAGGAALVLPTDMADSDAVEAAAEAVERRFGPIDIWVNCAMATIFANVWDITPEEYRRATEVTYLGYVWGTMAAVKRMRRRNHGTIVQVGSALAYRAIPLQAPYCGAKFAIRGFTDSLRTELIHEGSRVHLTMVQMPALNTPQFGWVKSRLPRKAQPVPPIFQPEVAARAIYYAAHHPTRREYYVGWSAVKAIVANKFAPSLVGRYLSHVGYEDQQFDGPEDPARPDNLWKPVRGDHGAHGSFDDRAHSFSLESWAETRPRWLFLAAGLAVTGAALRVVASHRKTRREVEMAA
jgi:NAD(P)-dependent dehydrogenase (short-subunit alcohol dehydrogenase family)